MTDTSDYTSNADTQDGAPIALHPTHYAPAAAPAPDPLAAVADHYTIRNAREILDVVNGDRECETFGTDDMFMAYARTLGVMAAHMQSLLDWIAARADRLAAPAPAARGQFDWEHSPTAGVMLGGIGRELGADPSWAPHVLRILKRDNPAALAAALSAAVQENADRLAADPAYNRG